MNNDEIREQISQFKQAASTNATIKTNPYSSQKVLNPDDIEINVGQLPLEIDENELPMSLKTTKMKDSRKLDTKGFGNKRGPNKPSQDDQLINGRSEIKK